MKWKIWTIVAVVGIGAAYLNREIFERPEPSEVASAPQLSPWSTENPWPINSAPKTARDNGLRMKSARGDPADRRTEATGDVIREPSQNELPLDDELQLNEELRWTERALSASRQTSARPTAERGESGFRPSREALAAAAADSSAKALGCGGTGHACRSSADCCPDLACNGGVAGFGTAGHCRDASRAARGLQ